MYAIKNTKAINWLIKNWVGIYIILFNARAYSDRKHENIVFTKTNVISAYCINLYLTTR